VVVGEVADSAVDAALSPDAFVATTLNAYVLPRTSPVTTHVSVPVVVQPKPLGVDETVYPVIDCPPVFEGAAHVKVTVVPSTVTEDNVGASGIPSGTTVESADNRPYGRSAKAVLTEA